jgi:hypothetical protein
VVEMKKKDTSDMVLYANVVTQTGQRFKAGVFLDARIFFEKKNKSVGTISWRKEDDANGGKI